MNWSVVRTFCWIYILLLEVETTFHKFEQTLRTLLAIEWPERLGDALMPAEYLELRLEILGEEGGSSEAAPSEDVKAEEEEEVEEDEQPRIATLIARGDEWERRLEQIPILVERGQSENE